jgi:hypothetical protein
MSPVLTSIGDFSDICTVVPVRAPYPTQALFGASFTASSDSPIDRFLANANALNVLYLNSAPPLPMVLGHLVLLGYVSAVESYLRALIRELINHDPYSRWSADSREITFGSALRYQGPLLPEVLTERQSLAGDRNIREAFRELLGIKQLDASLKVPLDNFDRICHLRHCCTHRFGHLGTHSAMMLGFDSHSQHLEKPIQLSNQDIDEIASALRNFVKAINKQCFKAVLERSAKYAKANKPANHDRKQYYFENDWLWNYVKDARRFKMYYDIFKTERDATPSLPVKELYDRFRTQNRNVR